MRFVVAFAALALLVTFPGVTLGSSQKGSSTCPCIEDHWDCVKGRLESNESCPDDFGIDCKEHKISAACAVHLYRSDAAAQLRCRPSHSGESPWCETKWCYVNPEDCSVDWDWGVLGAYSYATCGNLRQGTEKYFPKALAAFLQNDPLRVLHPQNTLDRGYLGNTECTDHYDPKHPHQKCKGLVAEFWAGSLDELNKSKVQIDHTVIRRGENGIDQYFIGSNITNQFEEYKQRLDLSGWPTTNFDLCAFATGMGYVDLCSGALSLTHRRQAMTFMIELYTSPVFMVSKSTCDFLASDDWGSEKFWVWWVFVFSPGAWGFFVGVVLLFIVAMKGLDKCIEEPQEPQRDPQRAGPRAVEAQTSAMDRFRKCFCCFADALFGVFEAFAFQSKTSHRRDSNKPSRSRPSHALRLGLGFFILLSTTVYGAKITAEMVSAKMVKGEFESLEEAKKGPNQVTVCTHSVFEESLESLELHQNDKILLNYSDDWEEVLKNLNDKNCNCTTALLDEEAWNTFRSRGELCDFYKEPTAEFYVPTGVVVSKRAYRTLETFRFAPSETATFFDKSQVPGHVCPPSAAEAVCDNIIKDGVPWYMLFSLFLVAAACALCSLIGIALHGTPGVDEENQEEEEKQKKKKSMEATLQRIDKEMNMANIKSLLDLEFGKISRVLQHPHSDPRSQAELAGSATPDAAEPESQNESSRNQTGGASSTSLPNSLRPEFRRDPCQPRGSKEVLEHAQG
eukprot:s2423_g27.t1